MVQNDTLYIVIDRPVNKYGVRVGKASFYWYESQVDAEMDVLPSEYRVVRTTQAEFERERGW